MHTCCKAQWKGSYIIKILHPIQLHPIKLHPTQLHPIQLHPIQLHPIQLHPTQLHPTQLHPIKLHPIQLHPIQLHPIQLHPIQLHPIQLHPTQFDLPVEPSLITSIQFSTPHHLHFTCVLISSILFPTLLLLLKIPYKIIIRIFCFNSVRVSFLHCKCIVALQVERIIDI